MRIKPEQSLLISQCIHHHLGDAARVWLFGSRVNDDKRGGDIDLYVETTPHPLMNELRFASSRLRLLEPGEGA